LGPSIDIAVVIATNNRSRLLSERAIPSVIGQIRQPEYLVVIDDSSRDHRQRNAELVAAVHLPGCEVTYMKNARSDGASGCWNTALDFLFGIVEDPERLFVAILDDDDAWASTYLERCYAAACDQDLDMAASDIRRFEAAEEAPRICKAPEALCANDFLTGNPGIQGSNLFLRMSALLRAGGFDEALRSTTDRDLCIRIADLGTVRYGRLPIALVDHFAEPDRIRLSKRGSQAKLDGLTAFWRKYLGRMTPSQRRAVTDRAAKLFDWIPPLEPMEQKATVGDEFLKTAHILEPRPHHKHPVATKSHAPDHQPFSLYVGVIASDPPKLRPLLNGLASLQASPSIKRLVTLILDNGAPSTELERVVQEARQADLEVAVVGEAQQHRDAAAASFGTELRRRPKGQVGIAQARTMLQRYLGALLDTDQGSFGWVLDDDMRVDDRARVYLPWLPAFREEGVDVLIGAYEGSSPNPPLNGLRVHLVDLYHNLIWLRNLPPEALLPDRAAENATLRARFPDYYYDLSRKHTGHLEMPHWLEPIDQGESVAKAYSRLLSGALGILSGIPLTRPIVASMPSDPLVSAKDSVNRGGCTFVLNSRALTRVPNTIPHIQGHEARRSDMIWAIVNRYYRHMTIQAVGFPIHHVGRGTSTPSLNLEKVQGEIVGSALYAGLTEFLSDKPHHELDFSSQETEQIQCLAKQHMSRRLQSLEQSFHRIAGLSNALRRVARLGELDNLLEFLDHWFTQETFVRIRMDAHAPSSGAIENFLASLRTVADDFAARKVNTDFIHAQLRTGADIVKRVDPLQV
jgi:hypothetical protein